MIGKLLGSALILGASSSTGFAVAANLARRPAALRQLATALSLLATEVGYGQPLPTALPSAGRAAGPLAESFFGQAAALLRQGGGVTAGQALLTALDAVYEQSPLQTADREPLLALAAVLGGSGRDDQLRHLGLCQQRLTALAEGAEAHRQRYERLARYSGVLSGLALVLLLL